MQQLCDLFGLSFPVVFPKDHGDAGGQGGQAANQEIQDGCGRTNGGNGTVVPKPADHNGIGAGEQHGQQGGQGNGQGKNQHSL